ncbi:MAG: Flp pilus assembly protein CpaB [Oligoflexia bacterium]|nr:Flp pilus assembly protein CpaB [Oligoflexia bacterium]MBF0364766.1 Flp pilus assembly protein CpaB [Oligoflexia bacterium]
MSRAFVLSLVVAGIAMMMVYSYINGRESYYLNKYGNESSVVVAKVDIKELEMLDESKVNITKMPQQFLAPGHIKDIKEVFNTIATVPILKGEQITKPRITYPGARTGLSRQVSIGKRAFSILVDNSQAVSRLIKPGDRVDVVALIDYAGGKKDFLKAQTVLQDVLVLSTGLSMTNALPLVGIKGAEEVTKLNLNTYTDYTTVTLELDPFQVQKLIFMTNGGSRPYLSLRNNDDKQQVRIKGSKLYDVLGDDADEAKSFFASQAQKLKQQ